MPDALKNLPDISFIENKSIDQVRGELVADYESFIAQATGKPYSLSAAAPHRMELYAGACQIYQAFQYIDRAGKLNLLKYTYGDYLDHVASLKRVERNPASPAVTTIRFTLSGVRTSATGIDRGTRISTTGDIYFATDRYAEIPAGALYADVPATCIVAGEVGNGLAIGELKVLVDPIPYVESVKNTTATEGGADVESDEDFKERVYLAPSAYSTAGPVGSYVYHAKKFSSAVGDVKATSDKKAGQVDVVFLMADGTAPGEEMIEGMEEYLKNNAIRPDTDLVTVAAPTEVSYTIDLTYYINRSDAARAVGIQAGVQAAVAAYQAWQRKIGRDVNPDKLRELLMAAGVKRIDMTAPVYAAVAETSVAGLTGTAAVTYGGLEDD